ncbi:DUF2867 domain-containing protein [Gordonibacter massiliensis (ex Traore et al. 2017)]|uniref:DUF2867 domain-containing protein n=1 Tax=Gordonibacter massiliensis (ex Traore et al. 2017) TaxID=1841863 RepID=UPI001C8BCA64|nr:DUF2867 domain-containing protein [Gordonibacter massiliensis (ex Traore et al. 2017)]MBX9035380.1 DUF2867 domain-containing protein [Gordonibacter massiliensis (ex Traore et al. 2017)]
METRARKAKPQPSDNLVKLCREFTWEDCWELPASDSGASSRAWAEAIFSGKGSPWIVARLMDARNFLMARYEKRGEEDQDMIGSFPVIRTDAHETILGKSDRHLAFFTSITVDGKQTVRCTTIMKINNMFGRFYWFFVRKAHPFIIKAAINCAAKAISE